MTPTSPAPPSARTAWLAALRPRTLVAGVVPVAVGTALAIEYGTHQPVLTLICVGVSLLLQVGVNLHNDFADAMSGADDGNRLGPQRATAEGWIAPTTIRNAAYATLALAGCLGMVLVAVGGLPIFVAGVLSILAALGYTGGPAPLGYRGLGELLVFTFFGLVATGGTFFLHTGVLTAPALWAAATIGSLASAILVVNNLRDRHTDKASGKRTLAVVLGARATRLEYTFLIAFAYLAIAGLWLVGKVDAGWLLPLLSLPLAGKRIAAVWSLDGRELNGELARTAQLELLFGLLLSVGAAL